MREEIHERREMDEKRERKVQICNCRIFCGPDVSELISLVFGEVCLYFFLTNRFLDYLTFTAVIISARMVHYNTALSQELMRNDITICIGRVTHHEKYVTVHICIACPCHTEIVTWILSTDLPRGQCIYMHMHAMYTTIVHDQAYVCLCVEGW